MFKRLISAFQRLFFDSPAVKVSSPAIPKGPSTMDFLMEQIARSLPKKMFRSRKVYGEKHPGYCNRAWAQRMRRKWRDEKNSRAGGWQITCGRFQRIGIHHAKAFSNDASTGLIIFTMLLFCALGGCAKYGAGGVFQQMKGDWAQVRLPQGCKVRQIAAEEGAGVVVLCEDGRVFH